ncbi:GNAT family N-acetyltransferase [Paenibacillus dakarensis]|uniref:GNAT family N-acetyltransferase n=1 Tax=Paenibacillus dakarensis TaxID=1527293 RepID=UPI0006D5A441|nr:GNAT family N-acetyltransferase [Paenibacillus dakarensis]
MICSLSLDVRDTVQQIWALQHMAYPIEAQLIGLKELPPLMDTFETISTCGETFYGEISEDGELVGVIAVEPEENQVTISRMMVHPGHFRKGVAANLIQYVLETHSSSRLFIVSTGTKNVPAVTLYKKFGFKPVEAYEVAPGTELTEFHLTCDGVKKC